MLERNEVKVSRCVLRGGSWSNPTFLLDTLKNLPLNESSARKIVEEMIILYGSVARKEESSESDVDIAIVLKKQMDEDSRKQFISWSANLDLKFDKVFSIIDIEKGLLDKWGATLPFYRNIKEEGVVLWKAA